MANYIRKQFWFESQIFIFHVSIKNINMSFYVLPKMIWLNLKKLFLAFLFSINMRVIEILNEIVFLY